MKCEQCGAEIKSGETFCRVCGARISASAENTEVKETNQEQEKRPSSEAAPAPEKRVERKPKRRPEKPAKKPSDKGGKPKSGDKKKLVVMGAAAVAVVAIIVVVLMLLLRGGKDSAMSLDPNRPFAVKYDGKAIVYDTEGTALFDTELQVNKMYSSSWNQTTFFGLGATDYVFVGESGEWKLGTPLVMSADGSTFVIAKDQTDGTGRSLYRFFPTSNDQYAASNVVGGTIVLSPDGTRIAYNVYDEASDADHTMTGPITEKGERLLDCEKIYALSNDGAYVYFINNGRFYVEKNGDRTRLCELTNLKFPILMNATGDEIIFATRTDGVHYVHGGVDTKISNATTAYGPVHLLGEINTGENVAVVRTETFAGTVLLLGETLYGVEKGSFAVRSIDNCLSAVATEDGKKLVYVDASGRIHTITDPTGSKSDVEFRPEERATEVFAAGDLSTVYFTNARGELWRLRGDKADMVSADAGTFCMSEKGTLYFLYDGVVLCRANGTDRVSLERLDNFERIETVPQGVVVHLKNDTAKYYKDGLGEGILLAKSGPTA